MSLRRKVRRAVPGPLRQRLYDWSPGRRRKWRASPGLERTPSRKAAALTFDDGPDERFTPRLLETLGQVEARATFFVVGDRVAGNEELLAEMHSRGHEIALHGMAHRRHDGLSAAQARAELTDGLAAIDRAGLPRPRWYRPPYGAASPLLAELCRELDLGLAYWSAWGQDWDPIPAARIAALVERDLAPGAVILLHDSPLYAERQDAQPTIDAVPLIAAAARDLGLGLVALQEAL